MTLAASSPSPWAYVCKILFFAVLAFSAYVGVRFVDRATASLGQASAVFGR